MTSRYFSASPVPNRSEMGKSPLRVSMISPRVNSSVSLNLSCFRTAANRDWNNLKLQVLRAFSSVHCTDEHEREEKELRNLPRRIEFVRR
jgi:hypothetical protein